MWWVMGTGSLVLSGRFTTPSETGIKGQGSRADQGSPGSVSLRDPENVVFQDQAVRASLDKGLRLGRGRTFSRISRARWHRGSASRYRPRFP